MTNRNHPHPLRLLGLLIGLTLLLAACRQQAYWIPPSSASLRSIASVTPAAGEAQPGEVSATPEASTPGTAIDPEKTQDSPEKSQDSPVRTQDTPTSPQNTPASPQNPPASDAPILYYVQAADTLPAIAVRFGVQPGEVASESALPAQSFLKPGQLLVIPRRLTFTTSAEHLLPDSEVVYSPSATDFDSAAYVDQAGGYLSTFQEWHRSTGFASGAAVLQRVALENSVNPRLLLALLEYESGWVSGQPASTNAKQYPLGWIEANEDGLYNQLVWAVNQLSNGYYAWREGRQTQIDFQDGSSIRLAPDLNAGTVALMNYFAQQRQGQAWLEALDPTSGFPALYQSMFGDPWSRAAQVEPLFPHDIRQPPLTLPFQRNWTWSFTGGPHGAWEREGAFAALDFAPGSTESGCVRSSAWVVAASSGLVVRSGSGVVVLDLDGDGFEQTGWVLVYLHVSSEDRIPVGEWRGAGDPLGHPSCEGGISTGTHLHLARKYNGEWIPAAGPLPFNLGGWVAHAGDAAYQGTLTRGEQQVEAISFSSAASFILREPDDP